MTKSTTKTTLSQYIRQAVVVTLLLLIICGFAFPVVLSGISALLFPEQSEGSLVKAGGKVVGAHNVGQEFTES